MPEPRKQSEDELVLCKETKQRSYFDVSKVRKLRVICTDPDATDDSSSEDEGRVTVPKRLKRIVSVINFPARPNVHEIETSCQNANQGKNPKRKRRVLAKTSATAQGPNRFKGVRQRKWGKWAAEIRHPFEGRRIWLGTFSTPEEASKAYEAKKQEFALRGHEYGKRKVVPTAAPSVTPVVSGKTDDNICSSALMSQTEKATSSITSQDSESAISHTSPASVLDLETSASNHVSDDANVNQEEDVDTQDLAVGLAQLAIPDFGMIQQPASNILPPELIGFDFGYDLDLLSIDDLTCNVDAYAFLEGVQFDDLGKNEASELPDYDFDDIVPDELFNITCS